MLSLPWWAIAGEIDSTVLNSILVSSLETVPMIITNRSEHSGMFSNHFLLIYVYLWCLKIPKNISPLSPRCLLPTPFPSPSLLYPPFSPPPPSSHVHSPPFCSSGWSVAPQGEVWRQIDGVLTWLWSVRFCSFPQFFPSPSLPLRINSYSIPPFLHHSFFHIVLHSISSSHHLLLFSIEGSSISSPPSPCILFFLPLFGRFSPLPSSALTD